MILGDGRGTGPSSLTEQMTSTVYKTFQLLANYNIQIKKHDIMALAGYAWEDERSRNLSGYRNKFPSDDTPYLDAGGADGQLNEGGGYDWAMQSLFGRIVHNYDSSRFPTGNKYAFFPSVAVGWRVSEESFWKSAPSLHFFSNLKLRASHGVLGLTSPAMFGKKGYSFDSYMRGRQYYYSFSLGAAYRVLPELSAFAGVRGVYALSNYYGYVRNIKVGNVPLYTMLDATKTGSADIELNCDQSGVGFTPVLGIDYKTGRWNFAMKYEFKTRMRLKNEAVNQLPSIGNLPQTLGVMFVQKGMTPAQAQAVLTNPTVLGAMKGIKEQFDQKIDEATGEFADGKKVAADIPAYLAIGAGYSPIDALRINAGFHYFFDKQATAYQHREDKLKRGTMEWNAGVEFDATKAITVSTGWQNTSYGLTKEYMDDKSFVANSNSVGVGACIHLSKKIDLNVAYFHTFYSHFNGDKTENLNGTILPYKADFTRNNNVFGAGVDINF